MYQPSRTKGKISKKLFEDHQHGLYMALKSAYRLFSLIPSVLIHITYVPLFGTRLICLKHSKSESKRICHLTDVPYTFFFVVPQNMYVHVHV